ncbi:DNA topoisomerase [Polychytrium aggregatum]|uniref:DNA topoisomerase n=1 Tax=Polychytrium aggregatum TaxID=110093 RepID=UPI0022FECB10|nr:DNA topoisomerase [Polychytrium aggregatum]KAI9205081.1 DNA topoisomerase [Polychytrium aggregatum]
MKKILCVAEKPSISKSVASALSSGQSQTRNTGDTYTKNYDFEQHYEGELCTVTMTAVRGHLYEIDFGPEYRSWKSVDMTRLFDLPVNKTIRPDLKKVAQNIQAEAKRAHAVVIWTDCDLEGENIGAEIAMICCESNPRIQVKRARFSVVQPREIREAWGNLTILDPNQVDAVDARQELDLRIGAVFTRFQTLLLRPRFEELNEKSDPISYGGCQFPTLGFVVDQFLKAKSFVHEAFWKIEVTLAKDGQTANFSWERNRLFDQRATFVIYELCMDQPVATVTSVQSKPKDKWRPLPLTTVEFQKSASKHLRISSDRLMKIAEDLYNRGFLSYPRTETDVFEDNFELRPLIEKQTSNPNWGEYAQRLLAGGFKRPRKGKNNDKAHPPIHPTQEARNLTEDETRVYDFAARRFLACCSDDAKGHETVVEIDIAGEKFTAKGLAILEKNYLEVYIYDNWSSTSIPHFELHEQIEPSRLEMVDGKTSRPSLLTEAELITLMNNSGIGTDATIHEHIKKILDREYATKERGYFSPTTLGMGLVQGYDAMSIEIAMSKPYLRSQLEDNINKICRGEKTKEQVVQEGVEMYKQAFLNAKNEQNKLIESLAAHFGHDPTEPEPSQGMSMAQIVRKCPKCDKSMSLKRTQAGFLMIGCIGYPECKEAVFFPSILISAELSHKICPRCSRQSCIYA